MYQSFIALDMGGSCERSRKQGQATYRNRLRRLYREAFRLTRHSMPVGLDLVLIPRRPQEPTLDDLKNSLPRLVAQLAKKFAREAAKQGISN